MKLKIYGNVTVLKATVIEKYYRRGGFTSSRNIRSAEYLSNVKFRISTNEEKDSLKIVSPNIEIYPLMESKTEMLEETEVDNFDISVKTILFNDKKYSVNKVVYDVDSDSYEVYINYHIRNEEVELSEEDKEALVRYEIRRNDLESEVRKANQLINDEIIFLNNWKDNLKWYQFIKKKRINSSTSRITVNNQVYEFQYNSGNPKLINVTLRKQD